MSTRVVIITNPAHDRVTQYLHSWSELVISNMKNQLTDVNIHELKNNKVTKKNLVKLIEEKNPHLILFHGHGGSKIICGFEANTLIACDDNEELLKSKIVHSLTCNSGGELGLKCINLGTKAFIGYKKEFKFAHMGKATSLLQQSDVLAEMFLRPAFEVNRALLKGDSPKQAYKKSQQMYISNLQILLTSKNPNFGPYRSRLFHDLINQVVLGN